MLPAVRAGELPLSHHHGAQSIAAGECDEVSAVRLAHGRSQSRAYFAAGSERAHGASAWPSEVDDGAARCFRGGGSAARHGRHLRRGRLHSRATNRRNRSAYGARRANDGHSSAGRESGNEAGGFWIGDWSRRGTCARPLDCITTLRDIRAQSAPVDRDNRGPWNSRVTRVFISCAAGESAQSSGSTARRVIFVLGTNIPRGAADPPSTRTMAKWNGG